MEIKKGLLEEEENKITIKDLLEPAIFKPFTIAIIMYFFLNLSGLNIMIFYCNSIFFYSGSSLNSNVASIIAAIVLLVSSFVAIIIITKLPRKIILIVSMAGMSVCYVILGACFRSIEEGDINVSYPLFMMFLLLQLIYVSDQGRLYPIRDFKLTVDGWNFNAVLKRNKSF